MQSPSHVFVAHLEAHICLRENETLFLLLFLKCLYNLQNLQSDIRKKAFIQAATNQLYL